MDRFTTSDKVVFDFDRNYRESCFYTWFKAGRPKLIKALDIMPVAPDGRKPKKSTLERWMIDDHWVSHADAMEAEMSLKLDMEAIKERAETLRGLAKDGRELKERGLQYLKETGFDTASAAVRAVLGGVEVEFKYAGMADVLANISAMNDKQLTREALRLLGKDEDDDDSTDADAITLDDDSNEEDNNN